MTKTSARLVGVIILAACVLGGCTHAQLDFCPKGLNDPYGSTRP